MLRTSKLALGSEKAREELAAKLRKKYKLGFKRYEENLSDNPKAPEWLHGIEVMGTKKKRAVSYLTGIHRDAQMLAEKHGCLATIIEQPIGNPLVRFYYDSEKYGPTEAATELHRLLNNEGIRTLRDGNIRFDHVVHIPTAGMSKQRIREIEEILGNFSSALARKGTQEPRYALVTIRAEPTEPRWHTLHTVMVTFVKADFRRGTPAEEKIELRPLEKRPLLRLKEEIIGRIAERHRRKPWRKAT